MSALALVEAELATRYEIERAATPPDALTWALTRATIQVGDRLVPFGDVARDYQRTLLADTSQRLIVLKARQIGISQTVALLAAHEALRGGTALVVSRSGEQASEFLGYVRQALRGDPQAPTVARDNLSRLELVNGGRVVAQSATRGAGRGHAATLAIIDEMAWQEYARDIYTALLPTLAQTGGRLIVVSTPHGQGNLYHDLWQQAERDPAWSAHLLPWTVHPAWSADPDWRTARLDELGEVGFAQEFGCDFVASGAAVYDAADVAALFRLAELPGPTYGHRYVTAFDVARRRDAFVQTTIDISVRPFVLAAFDRALRLPYPEQARRIEDARGAWPGVVVVESNGVGDPLIEFLRVPVTSVTTTALSKRNALQALQLLLQRRELAAPTVEALPALAQLRRELLHYQYDDAGLVQDCVMALAIAALHAGRPVRAYHPVAGGRRPVASVR